MRTINYNDTTSSYINISNCIKNSVHISVEIFVIKSQLLRVGILDVIRDINI